MNKRTFLKSLVAAGCVAAFSLGSFLPVPKDSEK